MKSLKGQLLLDAGKLMGSEFQRAVVLICEHDSEGALGFVLNRVSGRTVAEATKARLPEVVRALPLHLGGPVSPRTLTCLIHEPQTGDEEYILPGLRMVPSLDDAIERSGDLSPLVQVKFFAGYSGWAAGQLDNEMKDDSWLIHPATIDLVFHPSPEQLWKTILRTKGPVYRLLADAPEDISNN